MIDPPYARMRAQLAEHNRVFTRIHWAWQACIAVHVGVAAWAAYQMIANDSLLWLLVLVINAFGAAQAVRIDHERWEGWKQMRAAIARDLDAAEASQDTSNAADPGS